MTTTPTSVPTHGTARRIAAIVLAVVVVLAAFGVGVAVGRSHHSSSPATTTTTTQPKRRKIKRCTKRKVRLGLCSSTSTTSAPVTGSSLSRPGRPLQHLALGDLRSKTGAASLVSSRVA